MTLPGVGVSIWSIDTFAPGQFNSSSVLKEPFPTDFLLALPYWHEAQIGILTDCKCCRMILFLANILFGQNLCD